MDKDPEDSPAATKRKAEEMSGGGGEDAITEPAEVVHQPGPDEAMDADGEFAVRMVETVDAAWHEAWENTAYGEAEDFDGEEPPDLSPEDLAELDDQAEIEELGGHGRAYGAEPPGAGRAPQHGLCEDVEERTQRVVQKGQAGGEAVPLGLGYARGHLQPSECEYLGAFGATSSPEVGHPNLHHGRQGRLPLRSPARGRARGGDGPAT